MASASAQASGFGKVAVLMGGRSTERVISLESGDAVVKALCNEGIDAHGIDFDRDSINYLVAEKFDRVFIALHGRGGEDGTVQGALETAGIPYTGSGVLASALAMDKLLSKSVWRAGGLPTPAAVELNHASDWRQVAGEVGLPIMVKPVNEGSSIGAGKVKVIDELAAAWARANRFDDRVMAETWIEGAEYTVPVLGDSALPMVKLETEREFYDYTAKYEDDDTRYICPCGLDSEVEKNLAELSLEACKVLGVSGWARVDLMVDESDRAWLIEVNTVPGMTRHSLVPMSAKQAGLSFGRLVIQILASSRVSPVIGELQN